MWKERGVSVWLIPFSNENILMNLENKTVSERQNNGIKADLHADRAKKTLLLGDFIENLSSNM